MSKAVERTQMNLTKIDLSIILPAHNEGATEEVVFDAVWQYGEPLLFNDENGMGYGLTIKTAMQVVKTEWVGIIDADNTYPAHMFQDLKDWAEEGYDMVILQRESWDRPLYMIARIILSFLCSIITGRMIWDINSGMRIFKKEFFDSIPSHWLPDRFSITTSLTAIACKRGLRIKYVPGHYSKRRFGESHVTQRGRKVFGILWKVLKIRLLYGQGIGDTGQGSPSVQQEVRGQRPHIPRIRN